MFPWISFNSLSLTYEIIKRIRLQMIRARVTHEMNQYPPHLIKDVAALPAVDERVETCEKKFHFI